MLPQNDWLLGGHCSLKEHISSPVIQTLFAEVCLRCALSVHTLEHGRFRNVNRKAIQGSPRDIDRDIKYCQRQLRTVQDCTRQVIFSKRESKRNPKNSKTVNRMYGQSFWVELEVVRLRFVRYRGLGTIIIFFQSTKSQAHQIIIKSSNCIQSS